MHSPQLCQILTKVSASQSVDTKDLMLAAKLAKVNVPEQVVAETRHAVSMGKNGTPDKILWKPFINELPPPSLRGPGGFDSLP